VTRWFLAVALALSLAWAAAIVAAPACLRSPSAGVRAVAVVPYVVGSRVCHQAAARSFSASGVPLPVCARCTGLYAGVPLGLLAGLVAAGGRPVAGRAARRLLAWAALPTLLTVVVEWAGLAAVPGWARATLGAALSGAAAFVVTSQLRAEDRAQR
jgi:hypothetical protein